MIRQIGKKCFVVQLATVTRFDFVDVAWFDFADVTQ